MIETKQWFGTIGLHSRKRKYYGSQWCLTTVSFSGGVDLNTL